MTLRRDTMAAFVIVFLGLLLRVGEMYLSPLWFDEICSLCFATGHLMSVPKDISACRELGDYISPAKFVPATYFKKYANFSGPLDLGRVVRVELLGDEHPPLHIPLLSVWLKVMGVSETALRTFSLLWSMATVPFIWLLGKRFGGKYAALLSITVFMFNPAAVHFAVEGRDYSMLMFFAATTLWSAIRLHDRGYSLLWLLFLTLSAIGGCYTHIFYSVFLCGVWLWLLLYPGRLDPKYFWLAVLSTGVCISPYYFRLFFVRSTISHHGPYGHWCDGLYPFPCDLTFAFRFFLFQGGTDQNPYQHEFIGALILTLLWLFAILKYSPLRSEKSSRLLCFVLLILSI